MYIYTINSADSKINVKSPKTLANRANTPNTHVYHQIRILRICGHLLSNRKK